ncbi:MAG: nitroreductase [Erysipelotrichaceae bacterium]|nr:nitroreductase [Erysipelotrichaceae bacterium]
MNAYETIITRRSTRKFRNREVDEKLTDLIIEAGRHAPSGGNSQSSHFFVITNRELLEKLALMVSEAFRKMEVHEGMYRSLVTSITRSKQGNYIFHYGCPMLIVVANKKDYGNNIADCACALENMMIAANSLDLGTCWINQLKWLNKDEGLLELFKNLGLGEEERIYGALAVGYPDTEDGLPVRTPLPRTGNKVEYIK